MFDIKTVNKISASGLDVFDKQRFQIVDSDEADAIMVRSASLHDTQFDPRLKAIARAGAGVNNIPIDRCTEQGIVVFNTPGANANAVKELVLGALFLSARKVVQGIEWAQGLKGQGDQVPALVEKGKSQFSGPELLGKRLGIIGLGAIGVLVANCATHLGMTVYGYDPYISVDKAWNLSRSVVHAQTLREIYENCDFITVHVPLTPETRDMLDAQAFGMCKHGVRILNFSRGELVHTEDMLAALDEGQVACYITDFPNEQLLGVDGVIPIPHLGASTPESEDNCARMAAEELVEYLTNGNVHHSVNLPELCEPRVAQNRIAFIHRNVPNMLSQITQVISEEGLNIETMSNRSRKDVAYTIVELEGHVSRELMQKLGAIENVIRTTLYR